MKVIVGITAASGSIYARLVVEKLLACSAVEQVALIYSKSGGEVMSFEGVRMVEDERVVEYDNGDMFAPVASGSARYDAMVIVPCSVGTVGRVAAGISGSLLERAADVMIKERRRVVMVVRETPFSLIHLRNMTTLAECGVTILPASPSFYSHPQTIEELCGTVVERIISQLGLDMAGYEWKGR